LLEFIADAETISGERCISSCLPGDAGAIVHAAARHSSSFAAAGILIPFHSEYIGDVTTRGRKFKRALREAARGAAEIATDPDGDTRVLTQKFLLTVLLRRVNDAAGFPHPEEECTQRRRTRGEQWRERVSDFDALGRAFVAGGKSSV